MRRRWLRLSPGPRENALAASVALGAAAAVAAVIFYFARMFFSREDITPRQGGDAGDERGDAEPSRRREIVPDRAARR